MINLFVGPFLYAAEHIIFHIQENARSKMP